MFGRPRSKGQEIDHETKFSQETRREMSMLSLLKMLINEIKKELAFLFRKLLNSIEIISSLQ